MKARVIRHPVLVAFLAILLLLVIASAISAASNIGLPVGRQEADRLQGVDAARLAEALHLKEQLGESIWPGWGKDPIPVIMYNDAYAFLVDYPNPPAGWNKVQDSTFQGQPYYQQALDKHEAFAIQVGDRWVGSLPVKGYVDTTFVNRFHQDLPPLVKEIFPYRLLITPSELQIALTLHETFHAYQAQTNPELFNAALDSYKDESAYPWDDAALGQSWRTELDLLTQAAEEKSDAQAAQLSRQFLDHRETRRKESNLTPASVAYEQHIEWLEGLAKHIELKSWRVASTTAGYQPLSSLSTDGNFKSYSGFDSHWSQEMSMLGRQAGIHGDGRFYYTGLAQATLLDRFSPGWEEAAMRGVKPLDDLLRDAVESRP